MARFERWLEVKRIFEEALETAPEERDAFLDQACRSDTELRQEVVALLNAPALPTSSLASLLGLSDRRDEPDYAEGDRVDHFTIVREVGKGGMGMVYEARDTRNNDRRVAVKVLFSRAVKLSQDKRLAGLTHPAIVTFHDSGETEEGLPYFVFEFIEGEPITAYCERHKLGVPDRLRLFQKVCEAVAYAHQRLVIHCDLKPENILVTAIGELKLLDFGIAKEVGAAQSAAGEPSPITLPFASPEQVGSEETTTLSDVYSLGVLLAVLLTGRLPYRGAGTVAELRDAILHAEPSPPSEVVTAASFISERERVPLISLAPSTAHDANLARRFRGDLDAIVIRALCKRPAGRYQSAADLAADVARYFADEPVAARPATWRYRAWKRLKRNRGKALVSALLASVLLAAAVVWLRQYRETVRQRDAAELEAAHDKELSDFLFRIFLIYNPDRQPGSAVTVRELLDQAHSELKAHLTGQPHVQARLLNTLWDLYQELGLYEETESCLSESLAIEGKERAPEGLVAAESLTRFGTLRRLQGRHKEAEELLRHSLRIEAALPPDDPKRTYTLFQLARAISYQGRYGEAESLDRRTLALRQGAAKPDRAAIAESLNALGTDLSDMSRFNEAEPYLRHALALRESLYSPGHPLILNVKTTLANVELHQGKYDDAIRLQQEVLAARRRAYGAHSHEAVVDLVNLGIYEMVKGDVAKAEADLRAGLGEARTVLGPEHTQTIITELQLGRALAVAKKYPEARDLLSHAKDIAIRRLGARQFVVGAVLQAEAQTEFRAGNFAAAEGFYRQAIDIFRATQGANAYGRLSTTGQLGTTLVHLGRFAEAEPMLLEFFDHAIPQEKATAATHVVELYDAWGKKEKAAQYRAILKTLPPSTGTLGPR
jgi:eukaryotic-like serine/threonine-protein kinase